MTGFGFDPDLVGAVTDLFEGCLDPAVVAAVEDDGLSDALWSKVAELGFPLVGVDEAHGGSGGTVMDALAIAVLAGRYAAPLPLVETNLAGWLLAESDAVVEPAAMTVAPGTRRDEITVQENSAHGVLHDVPWVPGAARVVAVAAEDVVLCLDPARCDVETGADLAGQPRSVVRFAHAEILPAGRRAIRRAFLLRGALLRAGQLAGAMDAVADMTIAYCGDREQFGRPLSRFQAVQQHLVTLAQAAELSAMSVLRAGLVAREREASFEILSAKLVANQCAADSVRATHQAHAAISMTREYRAQLFTRRLNAWRWEFGTEPDLSGRLGAAVADSSSFFSTVSAERESVSVTL